MQKVGIQEFLDWRAVPREALCRGTFCFPEPKFVGMTKAGSLLEAYDQPASVCGRVRF